MLESAGELDACTKSAPCPEGATSLRTPRKYRGSTVHAASTLTPVSRGAPRAGQVALGRTWDLPTADLQPTYSRPTADLQPTYSRPTADPGPTYVLLRSYFLEPFRALARAPNGRRVARQRPSPSETVSVYHFGMVHASLAAANRDRPAVDESTATARMATYATIGTISPRSRSSNAVRTPPGPP